MNLRPIPRMPTVKALVQVAREGADFRDWYRVASNEIFDCAPRLNVPYSRLAAYLALFSPRVSVKRSVRWAVHRIRAREFLPDCTRSTRAAVLHWERTQEIRGPKTRAFRDGLLGHAGAIVLDTWMGVCLNVDPKCWESLRFRRPAERRIRQVAGMLGWTPAQTQAALWAGTIRRSGPYAQPRWLSLTEEINWNPVDELPT